LKTRQLAPIFNLIQNILLIEELFLIKGNPRMKNKRMANILCELIKNSNRSDHQIAKVIGISQPTVTRLRNQLEKEGYIQEYTIIPNLAKMGYAILAIFCIKYKAHKQNLVKEAGEEAAMKHSSTVFSSRAQGMGKNAISISLFKNYREYAEYINKLSSKWDELVEEWASMLVDLKGPILKPFSLRYLVENAQK
jgi:DNA-binding Lrp family transcriptional regulator